MSQLRLIVGEESVGERLDVFVSASSCDLSRNSVQRLCEENRIFVNDRPANKNYKLRGGEEIVVQPLPPKQLSLLPQEIPLDIVYEDAALLVVNKPKGMVVHPAPGNEDHTLVNALLFHCGSTLAGIGGIARPGIVHRIDKDTSGLLVVAKTQTAHQHLSQQIAAHTMSRRYHAIVYGNIKTDQGRIDAPIGRHPTDRKRMCVTQHHAREAVTNYRVLARLEGFTYVELALETGRTHQIRVHMASLGHPVAGDPVYGPKKVITSLNGQCLHARTLGFIHPDTNEFVEFSSKLPQELTRFLATHPRKGEYQ